MGGRERTCSGTGALRQLREAEARYRSLVENMPAVTYVMGPPNAGRVVYISPQVRAMLGYEPEEFMEAPGFWVQILHPGDRDQVLAEWERTLDAGGPFAMAFRYVAKDGRAVWVHDSGGPVPDQPGLFQGVMFDITDRVEAEEGLRRRDAILEAVAFAAERFLASESWSEGIDDVLARLGAAADVSRVYLFENRDEDGTVVATQRFEWAAPGIVPQIDNPEMQDFAYEESDYGDWAAEMAAGREVQGRAREVSSAKRGLFEEQGIRALLLVPVSVDREWWGFVGFDDCVQERVFSFPEIEALKAAAGTLAVAITRERASGALREAETRYRTLVEQIPTVTHISRYDEASSTTYMSPQVEGMLGYSPQEWVADLHMWEQLVHPEDLALVMATNEEFLRTGEPFLLDYRLIAKDGRVVWIRDETVLIRDEEGAPTHAQGTWMDITDRKHAEEELHRSMEQLHRADQERRRLLAYLVKAQEAERARIAADIHDDPLQKVAAAGVRIGALRARLDDAHLTDLCDELEAVVNKAVGSLRHLLFELRPPALHEGNLGAAIRDSLTEASEEAGFTFDLEDHLDDLPEETRVICYRIAQEAVTNARKHASASRVRVRMEPRTGGVFVRIADDGVGFDPQGTSVGPGHLGVRTMRERAELAGGWLKIWSATGAGTTVEFWVPERVAA